MELMVITLHKILWSLKLSIIEQLICVHPYLLIDSLNIHESHFQVRGNEEHSYFRLKRTGVIYAGEWKVFILIIQDGAPNGYGKNYYPNGGLFEGSFVDGIPHGFGRFIMPNGDYYQGQVKYGRANGFGTY